MRLSRSRPAHQHLAAGTLCRRESRGAARLEVQTRCLVRSAMAECAVSVSVRVRPLSKSETPGGSAWSVDAGSNAVRAGDGSSDFSFDRVFGSDVSNHELYAAHADRLVRDAVGGYNACIFAYGQTARCAANTAHSAAHVQHRGEGEGEGGCLSNYGHVLVLARVARVRRRPRALSWTCPLPPASQQACARASR